MKRAPDNAPPVRLVVWKGRTHTLESLAEHIERMVIPGQPILSPAVAPKEKNPSREQANGCDQVPTANGGPSVGDGVGNGTLSTLVHTVPQARSTVPAAEENAGAGCAECCTGWTNLRAGDICPGCSAMLFGSELAYKLAEMRGYL